MLTRQLDRGGGLGSYKSIVHCAMHAVAFSCCRAVRPYEVLYQWRDFDQQFHDICPFGTGEYASAGPVFGIDQAFPRPHV